ncbi:MAG: alpha/beta hydrolase [Myxococcota bacterium]|nr:alpha/beta hydrolase [Myxococcota bacterium]MDW8362006.1 alpha/beta hydrolase [Myxococcales bacterium]
MTSTPPTDWPRQTRIRANGLEHHVFEWDPDGEPRGSIVLTHGWLDHGAGFAALAARLAAAGWRVRAFDWRGHGRTEHVGAGGYYHFPDYVLDLAELLPQLCPDERPVLVGHSMGGTASAMFAGTFPQALRALVLLEGLGPPESDLAIPDRFAVWIDGVRRERKRPARVLRDADEALARMRRHHPELPDELGRRLVAHATRPAPDGEGIVFTYDRLHHTRAPIPFSKVAFRAFLERITVPVLFVAAARGMRLPDEDERLNWIRNARRVVLEDCGHMMQWTAPDRLADVMLEFVARV